MIALLLLLVSGGAHADPAALRRAEAPVREVVLSDGTRRYAVPVRVGSTDILAGLDSGSTGLRILPNVLKDGDAQPTSQADSYSYGAGARLSGVVATGVVSVGGLAGQTTMQLVKSVGCSSEKPRCAAGSVPIERYGIQGDGLPDEGFKAILGVNMADADVASLFAGVGARRWIIELPRPGEAGPGRIVLNPTDEERQGFVNLPILRQFAGQRGGAHDAVQGCLINDTTQEKVCGAVVLDTGAPGIRVVRSNSMWKPWAPQTPATLVFADADGHVQAAENLVIDRREHASALSFQQRERAPMTMVMSGLTPYFAYSILYDPEQGTVGFRPRPAVPQGPVAMSLK
jgi:hypothetical protein